MKKLIALLLLLCTLTLLLSSCGSKKIEKPEDTNLEYWLLEKLDTDGCTELYIMGSNAHYYLAKGYEAEVNEKGHLVAPKAAVTYMVKRYPYRDWGLLWRISTIHITDPNVFVWGLTINSSREEFVETMTELGFEFSSENEKVISYKKGRTIVSLTFEMELQLWYNIKHFGSYIF